MSNKRLIGRTIMEADVDGFGIELTLDDGSVFLYSASDGGYSSYGFNDEETEDECELTNSELHMLWD